VEDLKQAVLTNAVPKRTGIAPKESNGKTGPAPNVTDTVSESSRARSNASIANTGGHRMAPPVDKGKQKDSCKSPGLTRKKQTEPPKVLTASKPVDLQLTKDVRNAALLDEQPGVEGHPAECTKPLASSQIPKNSYIYKIITKPSTDFTHAKADDARDSSTILILHLI
jgi:hypothetical protein